MPTAHFQICVIPLGSTRHRYRPAGSDPPRTPAHRCDLARRRRSSPARASGHPWARLHRNHPRIPTPGRPAPRLCRRTGQRVPQQVGSASVEIEGGAAAPSARSVTVELGCRSRSGPLLVPLSTGPQSRLGLPHTGRPRESAQGDQRGTTKIAFENNKALMRFTVSSGLFCGLY